MYIWLSLTRLIHFYSATVPPMERLILTCFVGTVLTYKNCSQACEWTGNCAIEGCKHKCQVQDSVGSLLDVLPDRAWDLDWWQVCPYLAMRVQSALQSSADSLTPAGSGELYIPYLLQSMSIHDRVMSWRL
jgi:hypothetical protein